MRALICLAVLFVFTTSVQAQQGAGEESTDRSSLDQFKAMSGMSVLGNSEAPKSLVIVPWKSSEIGDGIGVVDSLSNRPMPVDRVVFSRELNYYQIRSNQNAAQEWEVGSGQSVK